MQPRTTSCSSTLDIALILLAYTRKRSRSTVGSKGPIVKTTGSSKGTRSLEMQWSVKVKLRGASVILVTRWKGHWKLQVRARVSRDVSQERAC